MAIKYLNHIFKDKKAVSATPLKAPAEYTPSSMDAFEVNADYQRNLNSGMAALSQAEAAAKYASMYNSLSSATSSTGATSMYAAPAGYASTTIGGPAHVTWGPTTTITSLGTISIDRNVSEEEFKQLQVHVIELTELVGELLEEVRYLRSGKAA
jgi:hypothetical protein